MLGGPWPTWPCTLQRPHDLEHKTPINNYRNKHCVHVQSNGLRREHLLYEIFDAPLPEELPRISPLHFWKLESSVYIFSLIMGDGSIEIFLVGSRKTFYSATARFCRSRSSKVIEFGTSRKRV